LYVYSLDPRPEFLNFRRVSSSAAVDHTVSHRGLKESTKTSYTVSIVYERAV